ncbi:hypothetical protein F5888DRAFT_1663200 [Russula emetica]|nr:hypothetical protein F5888DRAFT_1663200 [Russula emetica]
MPTVPQVKSVKPKKHHGYTFFLFLIGTLFPPLAVAARFGIGSDFWLNLFLTLAGYIPGHFHNFYLQNIRNNKNHRRTPQWAQRHGLVDTSDIKRKERRSQWASRYEERLAQSTLQNQPVEDGQIPDAASLNSTTDSTAPPRRDGELWSAQDEQYYGQSNGSTSERRSSRWHYPANFDDADTTSAVGSSTPKKKKKIKKDRFARTEDAYSINDDTTPRRKKKRSKRTTIGDDDTYSARSSSIGQPEFPEDPEGGLYGDNTKRGGAQSNGSAQANDETNFEHQF